MDDEIKSNKVLCLQEMAKNMRLNALKMALGAGKNGAHLGPALSCMEIMAVLYGDVMHINKNDAGWSGRDRFIASKAHCVLATYTALHEVGFITKEELETFEQNGTFLAGHPAENIEHGIEYSGGSLGMALGVGIGIALNAKQKNLDYRTFILLGDGELDEGSNWEAFLAAPHFKLDNLTIIIDKNSLQYDGPTESVMPLGNLAGKLKAFNWHVTEINGHDINQLLNAFDDVKKDIPHCIIANTIKGKGVSFMENVREWHHSTLSQTQYEKAVEDVLEGTI